MEPPARRPSTPPAARRRRSSAAVPVLPADVAPRPPWDTPAPALHPLPQPSFSRHLQSQSLSLPAVNGTLARPDPSPTPPHMPVLPALLPATVYDPNSPHTGSSSDPPSTAGLLTPTTYTQPSADYFTSKPRPPPAQRPPSRTKADRVLGRSPLGSPPVSLLESEARHRANSAASRPLTAARPSTASARDPPPPKPAPAAVHERSFSKEHDPRDRSGSNASSRLDDAVQGTPPRTRERREKDKKTMLSRALQKANTAVLLDNAQNFEGAMEAYGDACKLLQQVMIRSSGEEDKRKLDAIVSFVTLFFFFFCFFLHPTRQRLTPYSV